jgi:hypothetical protein
VRRIAALDEPADPRGEISANVIDLARCATSGTPGPFVRADQEAAFKHDLKRPVICFQ